MSEASGSLADAMLALLTASGGEPPSDAIDRLGGWQRIAGDIAGIADHPVSVPLLRVVARDAAAGGTKATTTLAAVVKAVLAMDSPAGFGDSIEVLLTSPAVLDVVADQLADGLLTQVRTFAGQTDPTARDVDRAASALEGATRIMLGGYGSHFELLAALARFRTPQPRRFAAAVIRSVGIAVDQWPEASSLVTVVKSMAGLIEPAGPPVTGADPDAIASDATWVLANIEVIGALRADSQPQMVARFEASREYLQVGADTYGRDDAKILARVIEVVTAMAPHDAEPSITTVEAALPTAESIDVIVENQVRFNLTLSGLNHWYSDVKRQTIAAWVALIEDLEVVRAEFAQDSFYRPEAVIDDLLRIYQASRSARVVRRDDDFGGFLSLVQPVIESGFASKAAFTSNLDHYTRDLAARVDSAGTAQRPGLAAALQIAAQVLEESRAVIARGTPPGKGDGGAVTGPLPLQLEEIFGVGTPEAAQLAELGEDGLRKLVSAVENNVASRRVTLKETDVLRKIQGKLVTSPDYTGEVKAAVDEVLLQMVRFVGNRSNVQADRRPYLFDAGPKEDALHEDLIDFLYSALGPSAEMEIPNVGGGRADIRAKYGDFSIYLELKVDDTKKLLAEKKAFVNQAVTYQATDVRIGFLIALRTKAFPPGGAHPHLVSLFEHTTVEVPGDDVPRHLVLVDVPGNRTSPSDKKAT